MLTAVQQEDRARLEVGMVQNTIAVIRWQSLVDFLVLVTAIYQILRWGKEARALRIVLEIVMLGIGSLLTAHLGLKAAALGLAALAWMVPLVGIEGAVRTVTVPVEFRNVPQGLEIVEGSSTAIQAQLRTSAWMLDAITFTTFVARFDLTGAHEGSYTILVERRALDVPPGVTVERVSSQKLTVRLARRRDSTPPRDAPQD
jgi:hypothetical protein